MMEVLRQAICDEHHDLGQQMLVASPGRSASCRLSECLTADPIFGREGTTIHPTVTRSRPKIARNQDKFWMQPEKFYL